MTNQFETINEQEAQAAKELQSVFNANPVPDVLLVLAYLYENTELAMSEINIIDRVLLKHGLTLPEIK